MHTKTLNWLDFVVTDVFHHSFWLQTRVHWSETALEWCCRVTICQCADVRGCLFLVHWKWCLFKRLYAIFSVLLIASPAVTNPGFKNQNVQSSYGHISRRWTSLKVTGHICITRGLGSPLYSISVPEVLTRADVNFSVVSVCVCVSFCIALVQGAGATGGLSCSLVKHWCFIPETQRWGLHAVGIGRTYRNMPVDVKAAARTWRTAEDRENQNFLSPAVCWDRPSKPTVGRSQGLV